MAFGRQVIATGAVVWKRVLRIPPMRHGGASARPGAIDPLRLRRPQKPLREGRTEEPAPAMAFGRQVISTGAVAWKRVIRIPPMRHGGASARPFAIELLCPKYPTRERRTEGPVHAMAFGWRVIATGAVV